MDYKVLGQRIRIERNKLGLTQAELAEKISVTTPFVGQIERGERKFSIETLVAIAHELNISTDFLLRENLGNNLNSLFSELITLVENRDPKDIVLAIDVVRSIFDHTDKKR